MIHNCFYRIAIHKSIPQAAVLAQQQAHCIGLMPPKSKNPLPTAEIKKLKSALKARQGQEGIDELSKAYSEGTTEKKREILNKYIEDRTLSFRFEVAQETEFSKTESSTTTGRWMTLKQIAQREGMALDDPHLQWVIKNLPVRDHENPELAAEDVKQYRVEKMKDEVANSHKEATTLRSTAVGMERVKKTAATTSAPTAAVTNGPEVKINWVAAMRGIRKNISTALKEAMQLMSLSQQHRSSIDATSDKNTLKNAQGILQECIEATEDMVAAAVDNETDHTRMTECLGALQRTNGCFKDVLYHVAPRAKPAEKEDTK